MFYPGILYCWFSIYLVYCTVSIESYNIDTLSPIIITKVGDGPQSLFGSTVLLVSESTNLSGIIIGAPKANSALESHNDIYEPGVVWQCLFERESEVCRVITMDLTGNDLNNLTGVEVQDKKDHGWLGGSMAIDSENFVTCGSGWVNQLTTIDQPDFMNGICYWRNRSEIFENHLKDPSPQSRLLPLIDPGKQGNNYWGLGQAGFSVHIPPKRKEIIIGAPGVDRLKGSVLRYSTSKSTFDEVLVIDPQDDTHLKNHSYFGFSVASGYFFNDSTKSPLQYVAGAPRSNNLSGQVTIFKFSDSEKLERLFEVKGTQTGSYFGASICVVDVNGDGLDDLLVGAPHFTTIHSKRSVVAAHGDEGAVFVYLNTGGNSLTLQNTTLKRRSQAWAQFGTAIVNLGDINNDGFSDVAVGAPYEANGTGVVYIYHGSPTGLSTVPAQKIEAAKLNETLRGFGYSLSGAQDIDSNGYNDIAIGAYDSGQVVILKTRPLIMLNGSVRAKISRLSLDEMTFDIQSCVYYKGEQIPNEIVLQVNILTDEESNPPRVLLVNPNQEQSNTSNYVYYEKAIKGVDICANFTAVTQRLQGSANAVVIRQKIELPSNAKHVSKIYEIKMHANGQPYTELSGRDPSCKNCPLIDLTSKTKNDLILPLDVDCGEDDVCMPDLKLSVEFSEYPPGSLHYVIGSSSVLSMHVKVENLNETAIAPFISVTWKNLSLRKTPSECKTVIANTIETTATCTLGRLLLGGGTTTFLLEFDVKDLKAGSLEKFEFEVEAKVEPWREMKESKKKVEIAVIAEADIFLSGSSSAENFNPTTLATQLKFSQTFEVSLHGPTPIDKSIIEFDIPTNFVAFNESFEIQFNEPQTSSSQANVACDFSTAQVQTKCDQSNVTNGTCKRVKCQTIALTNRTTATITFHMSIDSDILTRLFQKKAFSGFKVVNSGNAIMQYGESKVGPYTDFSNKPDNATAVTEITLASSSDVPKWKIWTAVVIGFLLLSILVCVLHRCGCFDRKKKSEPEEEQNPEENVPLKEKATNEEADLTKDEDD